MYIIFDTETTGLPKDFSAPITDFDNWPRIVQIAWKVYDENGKNISSHNRIIKPEGFRIPEESIRIHRISNERANHEGILLKDALQEFVNCINQSDYLIAHNISFDYKVTACEFLRLGWANCLNDIVNVCTMNSTIDFCGIKGKMGIKPPSLTELHQRLFNKKFEDAHDALVDVEALARCFFELRKLNVLGFSKSDVQLFNSKYSEEQILNKWKQRNSDIPKDVGMTIFGVHTYHSVLEGASSASDYVKKAKEYGHSNLVLTDRANMSGGFTFFQKCKSESIKPIIGCEFYVTDLPNEDDVVKEKSTNVIQKIIIKDNSGFVNANRLNYLSFKKGFYRVPRISFDLISQNTDGVLLTTSSKQGYISKLLQMGKLDLAEQHIQYMLSLFGNKSYIAEIALEENYIQRQYNSFIINMSLKHNLALILSHDVYYSDKGGDINLDILNSINQKRSIEDSRTKDNRDMHYIGQDDVFQFNECFNYHYDEDFLKMCMITSDRVASTCNFEYEIGVEKYPQYKPTEDVIKYFGVSDTEGIIRKLSHAKLRQKMKKYQERGPIVLTEELIEEYKKRLDFEIEVIKDKKMLDYFLVVWELVRYCGENDILIGPGRGSAAGSLLSWCLDITKIDPLRFDLYFERFLNPEREGEPDIDIDFQTGSDELTDKFLYEKYGEDKVFPVVTFSTFNEKGCLKDVARAFGQDAGFSSDVFAVTKEMPNFLKYEGSLGDWFEEAKNSKDISSRAKDWLNNPENENIIKKTLKLQGEVRNLGKHAAGIVITPGPVWECMPVNNVKGTTVSGFQESGSGKDLSTLGILKLDRLNLTTLNIIKETILLIKNTKGIDVSENVNYVDLENPDLFEELRAGNSQGVFQFESVGMSKLIKEMHTENFEEMVAANALYRPGPMGVGAHEEYIRNKKNPELINPVHPVLEPLLRNTNGVLIFQEQLMFIAHELAGMSLGEGDNLRKVMDKASKIIKKSISDEELEDKEKNDKSYKEYLRLWDKFKLGCKDKGLDEKAVQDIEEWLVKYLGYSFNRCLTKNHKVLSKDRGYINILDVNIGEKVMGYNPKTGKDEFNLVKDIHHNGKKIVYEIKTKSGKTLECTEDHKIMTEVGMKTLKEILDNNLKIKCNDFEEIVYFKKIDEDFTYDLEIDSDSHNFYANDICVSNSHSVSYSYVAMQTLYLKKYYPVQFYTSLLNHAKNDPDWLSSAIMAAFFKNINILPPNRNSKWEYTMLDENTILMGFSSINGMGDIAYQEFQDIDISNITKDTFFTYPFKKFNKGNFEACLSAGVFDDWSDSREELLELRKNKMKKNTMQLDLFGQNSFDIFEESIKGKFEPTSELEKYKDFLKVCALDLKLFDKVSKLKKEFYDKYNILIESVINFESPNNFYYFVLKNMIQKTSKNGKQFWSLELSDGCSSVNLILWQDGHDRLKEKLEIGGVYVTKFSKDKNWLKFQDGSKFMKVF